MEGTPLMDELCRGPWPSHAKELKKTRYPVMMYEESMRQRYTQWGHGGMSSVPRLGSGAIARKSNRSEIISHSHLIRVLITPGNFFNTSTFRKLCEIADKYGDSSLHALTTNYTLEICGIMNDDQMEAVTLELNSISFDVGSAGDAIRNIPDCMGPALCEYALLDTPRLKHFMTRHYICPTEAMKWDGDNLDIDGDKCIRCMYCINRVPAIKPGDDRGVAITVGGKMKGKFGPMKVKVVFPFIKTSPPDHKELVQAFDKI